LKKFEDKFGQTQRVLM